MDFNDNNAQLIKPFFSFNGANSKFPVQVQIDSVRGGAKYDEEFAYPYCGPLKVPINDENKFICVDNLDSFLENGALSLVVKVSSMSFDDVIPSNKSLNPFSGHNLVPNSQTRISRAAR